MSNGPVEHVHLLHDPFDDANIIVAISRPMLETLQSEWLPVSAIRLHKRNDGRYEIHARGTELAREAEEPPPSDRGRIVVEDPPVGGE